MLEGVLWWLEPGVTVEQGERGCCGSFETELALAALEGDGSDR